MATDSEQLIELLDEAEQLVGQFSGGYSGEFLSAEEFHVSFKNAIAKLKQGDNSQINSFSSWFAPSSCWDDFTGDDGTDLANKIYELLLRIKRS